MAVYHLSPGVGTRPAHLFPGESPAPPSGGGGAGVGRVTISPEDQGSRSCPTLQARPLRPWSLVPNQPTDPWSGEWGEVGRDRHTPGTDDILVQTALTALALGPEAREALLQGIQVGHLGTGV